MTALVFFGCAMLGLLAVLLMRLLVEVLIRFGVFKGETKSDY